MKCPHCNQEHPEGTNFCPVTGEAITLIKLHCTNPNCEVYNKLVLPSDSGFCPYCGTKLFNKNALKIGDLYNHNGLKGVVISVDASGFHGLIMSLKRHQCQWYNGVSEVRTNVRHLFDGKQNQDLVLNKYGFYNYPAFSWCASLGDGWYLPAIGELQTLCDSINLKAVEETLTSCGDPLFSGMYYADLYLSSTEGDINGVTYDTDHLMVQVLSVTKYGGSITSDTKKSIYEYARAVHRF